MKKASRACSVVGVRTGISSPRRGPSVRMVRVGEAAPVSADRPALPLDQALADWAKPAASRVT